MINGGKNGLLIAFIQCLISSKHFVKYLLIDLEHESKKPQSTLIKHLRQLIISHIDSNIPKAFSNPKLLNLKPLHSLLPADILSDPNSLLHHLTALQLPSTTPTLFDLSLSIKGICKQGHKVEEVKRETGVVVGRGEISVKKGVNRLMGWRQV